ncbi:MAG: hypothetical protein ORN85_09580 [Sediminibacterium sp.]|nr:hypothetical protein [Sediminibacterium sp.]
MKNFQVEQSKIIAQKFLPLYFHPDLNVCIKILQLLYEFKVYYFEFTNRGENAPQVFAELQKYTKKKLPKMQLGIGTIKNIQDAQIYLPLNPKFMVSPHFNFDLHLFVQKNRIFWIPGAFTPTEIYNSLQLNYTLIKIFPAISLGYNYFKNLHVVYPNLKTFVSGGIDINPISLKNWMNVGVSLIGIGSTLINDTLVNEKNWDIFEQNIKIIKRTIKTK